MSAAYPGPLRDEPIAIELHNTVYAVGGTVADGLADPASAQAWLEGLAERLPDGGDASEPWPSSEDLVALRSAVRAALRAALAGAPQGATALELINHARRLPSGDPMVTSSRQPTTTAPAAPTS